MPAPRWPTTAARSCCSIRPASPRSAASSSKRRSAPRAIADGPAATERAATAGAAVPRARRRAPGAAPGGRRPHRGSRAQARSSQAAGQLRVQLGEAILPLAGVERLAKLATTRSACSASTTAASEIGYAFREVIDLMAIDHDVIPADSPGEVSGVTLIGGEPAELVDAHWLFAHHLGAGRAGPPSQPVCRLPERRSVDAEHAAPDRRGRRLSRRRRRGRRARPTWSSPPRAATVDEAAARADHLACAPIPTRERRRTTASTATTAPGC